MKTKILLVAGLLTAVGIFGFVQSRKESKQASQIESAISLAQALDKMNAGSFLKSKKIKAIGAGEFPSFSPDTLYVRFENVPEIESYNEGVLLTNISTDTVNALALVYGIARHTLQQNPLDYRELNTRKKEVDHVRALQYTYDVMRQIPKSDFRIKRMHLDLSRKFDQCNTTSNNPKELLLCKMSVYDDFVLASTTAR